VRPSLDTRIVRSLRASSKVTTPPRHLPHRGIHVVIEQESHEPRCGELPLGVVDILRSQVRKCCQDRAGFVALLQIALHCCHPDPGAAEHRSAGVHTAALLHTARIVG